MRTRSPFRSKPFTQRYLNADERQEVSGLWHMSAVDRGKGRYARLKWVHERFMKNHPNWSQTRAWVLIDDSTRPY